MSEKLKEYFDKRNFDKTSEPKPNDKQKINQSHLRFVVQHHIARNDHFDFRLEFEGVLLSWAVPKGLSFNPIDKRLAVQVENHPLNYRNFEGVIPKGEYGGGVVMLWDEGTWQALSDIKKGLANGVLKFVLNGKRLKGGWTLIKLKSKKQGENNWLLIKEKDEFAEKTAKISDFNTSIRTGRTMNEIKDNIKKKTFKNPFQKIDVQLAQNSATIPKSNDWLYEIKYDGYRIIAFIENNNVKLITRNGKNFTSYFKNIANSLALWSENRAVILDGEIVITDENGRTDFQLLQNHIK
ncbi:MAG: DNA polymerase ligase N-terminal domain-containing protein, partial [Clostridia bacterium]|nr:DNA polymerase ligase N-terminal domain-containing protein [Clostridia bacterium]